MSGVFQNIDPPHTARRVCTPPPPPPLWCGGGAQLPGGEGGGGKKFGRRQTLLCTLLYVSTLWSYLYFFGYITINVTGLFAIIIKKCEGVLDCRLCYVTRSCRKIKNNSADQGKFVCIICYYGDQLHAVYESSGVVASPPLLFSNPISLLISVVIK